MSQGNSNQGAVKTSEVQVDSAQEVLETVTREDELTVLEQLRRVTTDSLRKSSMILISDGSITWDGASGEVRIPNSTSVILKLLLNPASATARTINLIYTGTASAVLNGATPNAARSSLKLNNGQVLHIELSRSILDAASPNVTIDLATSGRRLVVYDQSTMPTLTAPQTGVQSTISIPLAVRQDDTVNTIKNLWWIPHGILWSDAITSYLGQITTTTTVPLGGILPIHRPDGLTDSGVTQAVINSIASGYWLCDGSLITNVSSPFFNNYTPNLNGNATPAQNLPATDRAGMLLKGASTSPRNTSATYVGFTSKATPLLPHTHTNSGSTSLVADHDHSIQWNVNWAQVGGAYAAPANNVIVGKTTNDPGGAFNGFALTGFTLVRTNSTATNGFQNGASTFITVPEGAHGHTFSNPTGSSGSSSTFTQDPRAFNVVYVMRII